MQNSLKSGLKKKLAECAQRIFLFTKSPITENMEQFNSINNVLDFQEVAKCQERLFYSMLEQVQKNKC